MKTRDAAPLLVLILCGISFWCTAVIASEVKATQVIKLWPKDAATHGTQGMGEPFMVRPDTSTSHDVTCKNLQRQAVGELAKLAWH